MTKLMRKYQKWLLAVFGSALMLVFLTQSLMGSMSGDPGKKTFAKVNGQKVSHNQRGISDMRYAILKDLLPGFMEQFGIQNEDQWFLLTWEARQGGFVGHNGDGRTYMEPLAETYAYLRVQSLQQMVSARFRAGQQVDPQVLRLLFDSQARQQFIEDSSKEVFARMQNQGAPDTQVNLRTVEGFEVALAELRGVLRMMTADLTASRLSDRVARNALAESESALIVDAIILDADRLKPFMPPPSAEELQAQFEKGKAIDPATAPDGVGYVMPPRVKVEWMVVDKAAIAKAVKLDEIAVNKHWRQNRTTYPGEFTVEKAKVVADLTEVEATRLMNESDRAIKSQVTLAIKDLPEASGFRTLPENWVSVRPTLASLAPKVVEAVKSATGVTIPTPTVESRENWMTAEALQTLPGIGGSSMRVGTSAAPFTQIAMQVRELAPVSPVVAVQVGVPFVTAPLQNVAGDHFVFTVVEARPSGPADSLEEVREKVAQDVLANKAYQRLVSNIDTYKSLAVSDGLEAVGKLAVEGTTAAAPTPRIQSRVAKDEQNRFDRDLEDKPVAEALWAVGGGLDPLAEMSKDTLASRTVAVARDNARRVVVAQVLQRRPLTLEALRRLNPQQLIEIRQRETAELFKDKARPSAYSETALKARLNYETVAKTKNEKKKS